MENAILKECVRALELENETLRATKRRKKVKEDPNSRFMSIAEIMAAKQGGQEDPEPEPVEEEEEDGEPQQLRRSGRKRIPTLRAMEADTDDEV